MSNAVRITIQPELSPEAAQYVQQHPREAESIVKRELEALARSTQGGDDQQDAETELRLVASLGQGKRSSLPPALRRFVVPTPLDPTNLTVSEAAKRLEVTRQTVYSWIEAHELIAFRVTENALGIPAEQIIGPKKVVPGITRVLEVIPEPSLAWSFLTQELAFFAGESARPIDVLKRGDIDAVVDAADSYGEAFS